MDNILGNWSCVSGVINGNPLDANVAASLKLKMTTDRYRTERGEQVLFDSTYKLDPARQPKWIEMVGTEGDSAGKSALGIFALNGDELKMCYTMPGGARPTEFESSAGSGRFLVTWKRLKA
jgi:uncharacterized protein (TIGR03067 family)